MESGGTPATVAIHYFSGTGNTARAADIVADRLRSTGASVLLHEIASVARVLTEGGDAAGPVPDLLVLMFPAYAFSPPRIVRRYIRKTLRLPRGIKERVRAAVVAVDGGNGVRAAAMARRMLQRRGYGVPYAVRLGYPNDWRQFLPPPDKSEVADLVAAGDSRANEIASDILYGRESVYCPPFSERIAGNVVAFQFNAMGRSFLSQFFVANDRCTTCRLCERTCPVGAIRIARGAGARPVWKLSCESCNRCINLCPERAIVTSWGRMAVAALLQVGVIWIAIALAGRSGFAWPIRAILIAAVSTAGVIMVLPPVVRLIDKIPVLRRVIAYGFNKNWNQYTAPGFHPPNDPGHKKTAR